MRCAGLRTATGRAARPHRLAQITQGYTGAPFECYAEKLDTDYIRRVSLATDLGIVPRTVPGVLQGRGWNWNRAKRGSGATAEPLPGPLTEPAARPHAVAPTNPTNSEARNAPGDIA